MILVLNLITTEEPRIEFGFETIPRILRKYGKGYFVVNLNELHKVKDISGFTHLILSGSGLSASRKNDVDEEIYRIINLFLNEDKAIFGICYGHQMLAKAVAGDQACRKAEIPEFGWKKLEIIKDSPIFEDIKNPVIIQSHYDEVCNLDDRFEILAKTDNCKIQAFRLKGKNVWGVQFHPEINFVQGCKMIIENINSETGATKFLATDAFGEKDVKQNEKIILNFLNQ